MAKVSQTISVAKEPLPQTRTVSSKNWQPKLSPRFNKSQLNAFEDLVCMPAGHMDRYKNLHIEDDVRVKIFGKIKQH